MALHMSLRAGRLEGAASHAPACSLRCRPQTACAPQHHLSPAPLLRSHRPAGARPCQRASQHRCRAAAKEFKEDDTFRIEKISFGSILTPIGAGLLFYGFGSYFQLLPGAGPQPVQGSSSAALLLIYGFPITLLGFALSYAQLKPVPCKTTDEALRLRESQATDIQKSVREDVTRYRYGDEQHLDEALNRVLMLGRPKGIPRRLSPKLTAVREEVLGGEYALVLEFEAKKKEFTDEMWQQKREKFQTFFGPGVEATISETGQGADVMLKCDGSGAGRGGSQQRDVLPPLTPGSKPRTQR